MILATAGMSEGNAMLWFWIIAVLAIIAITVVVIGIAFGIVKLVDWLVGRMKVQDEKRM